MAAPPGPPVWWSATAATEATTVEVDEAIIWTMVDSVAIAKFSEAVSAKSDADDNDGDDGDDDDDDGAIWSDGINMGDILQLNIAPNFLN